MQPLIGEMMSQTCDEISLSAEEAKSLLKGGLAKALQEAAALYVIPIWWIREQDGKPLILGNGSAFMLKISEEKPFLVTAGHVYAEFLSTRLKYPDTVCILGNIQFSFDERQLLAKDEAYDVATFQINSEEILSLKKYGKVPITGSQEWPPKPPEIDKGCFFVGFPGVGKKMFPYRGNSHVEIEWVGYTGITIVDGVSNTDISLILEHDSKYDVGLRPKIPDDWELGGCSGAPILSFLRLSSGLYSWRLAGIIYEANELIVKASRADCLNPDGSINIYPNLMAYK